MVTRGSTRPGFTYKFEHDQKEIRLNVREKTDQEEFGLYKMLVP